MKLSVETFVLRDRFNDEKAIEMIKKAGFDCYDYSLYWTNEENEMLGDDYIERAHNLRKISDELGIECNQAHAPFDSSFDIPKIARSIEFASILGAKNIIVHAFKLKPFQSKEFYDANRELYLSLEPYCKKFNICVSVENLFSNDKEKMLPLLSDPIEHSDFVKSLNSPWFNICIDVGHSAITGYKPENVISKLDNSLLKALHIHDNNYLYDLHMLPYTAQLDWNKIMTSLSSIGYDGDLTFELTGYLNSLPNDLLFDSLVFAEKVGRKLISEFEKQS